MKHFNKMKIGARLTKMLFLQTSNANAKSHVKSEIIFHDSVVIYHSYLFPYFNNPSNICQRSVTLTNDQMTSDGNCLIYRTKHNACEYDILCRGCDKIVNNARRVPFLVYIKINKKP